VIRSQDLWFARLARRVLGAHPNLRAPAACIVNRESKLARDAADSRGSQWRNFSLATRRADQRDSKQGKY